MTITINTVLSLYKSYINEREKNGDETLRIFLMMRVIFVSTKKYLLRSKINKSI